MALGSSGNVVATGVVKLLADTRQLKSGLKDAERETSRTAGALGKAAKLGGVAAVAGLGLVAKGLADSVKAAQEAEKSQLRMQSQLKALGLSFQQHGKHIDDVITKQSRLAALDDEDLQDSFTNLVRVTKDVNSALKLNGLAADIARAKGISLEAASKAVAKAYQGSEGAATRLGVTVQGLTSKMSDQEKGQRILGELQKSFAGQAEAYGASAAGAQERLGVAFENLKETIGEKLLPVVTKIVGKFAEWIEKVTESEEVQKALKIAGQVLKEVFDKLKTAVEFNIRIFRTLIEVWVKLGEKAYDVFNKVKDAAGKIKDAIVGAFKTALEFVRGLPEKFREAAGWVADKIQAAFGKTWSFFGGAKIVDAFKAAFDWMKNALGTAWARALEIGKEIARAIVSGVGDLASKIWNRIKDGFGWLKDKLFGFFGGDGGGGDGIGDAWARDLAKKAPQGGAASRPDVMPSMWDELGIAKGMGLSVISTYRAGSTTASGSRSGHSYYPARAIDISSGSSAGQGDSKMRAFFNAMIGRPGIDEVILSPLIWTPSGGLRPIQTASVKAQHWNHVHVADYPGVGGDGQGLSARFSGRVVGGDGFGLPDFPVGAKLTDVQAARLTYNAGFRGANWRHALRILFAESNANWSAVGDGGKSFGGWQFYTAGGLGDGVPLSVLKDPEQSTARAYRFMVGLGNWDAWSTNWNGAGAAQDARAGRAITAAGTPSSAPKGSGSPSGSGTKPSTVTPQPAYVWPTLAQWKKMKAAIAKKLKDRTQAERDLLTKFKHWRLTYTEWKSWPEAEFKRLKALADAGRPDTSWGGSGTGAGTGAGTGGEAKDVTDGEGSYYSGGGGSDGGGTDAGGGMSEEDVQARLDAEAAAIWGARARFFTEFSPNVFTRGPAGLELGSSPLASAEVQAQLRAATPAAAGGVPVSSAAATAAALEQMTAAVTGGTAGGRGPVTVNQFFTAPPVDHFVNHRRAEFAAAAAFGR